MIKSLQISNFQSHKSSLLEFDNGVNVIIGQSDSGKSAILRALLWLVTNRPSGESFRSNWGRDTEVEMKMDGGIVSRTRGKGKNQYILNGQTLASIGTDVPVEVMKMLDLKDVNVQHQLDAPFLLSETAGEVARQLNQIANLEVIDTATTNIARTIRQYTNEEAIQETELDRIVNELRQYEDVPEQEKLLGWIVTDDVTVGKLKDDNTDVLQLVLALDEAEEELTKVGDVERMTKLYDECECLNDAIQKKWTALKQVNEFVGDIEVSTRELEDLDARLKAEQSYRELTVIIEQVENLKVTEKQCGDLTMSLLKSQRSLKEQEQEYEKLNAEWKRIFPDECPLCGQKAIRQ